MRTRQHTQPPLLLTVVRFIAELLGHNFFQHVRCVASNEFLFDAKVAKHAANRIRLEALGHVVPNDALKPFFLVQLLTILFRVHLMGVAIILCLGFVPAERAAVVSLEVLHDARPVKLVAARE